MAMHPPNALPPPDERADVKPPLAGVGSALQFKIGDRLYWLSRSRDGLAWQIVANADVVERASILYYGDVTAFCKMAVRLQEIEKAASRSFVSGMDEREP